MRAEKEIRKLFTMQDALCVSVYVEHILTFFNWLVISFIWFELYCNNINVRLILSAYYAFVLLTEFQVTYLGGNFFYFSHYSWSQPDSVKLYFNPISIFALSRIVSRSLPFQSFLIPSPLPLFSLCLWIILNLHLFCSALSFCLVQAGNNNSLIINAYVSSHKLLCESQPH